jgi:NADH:ubiquinone oxidoreductase subunit 3 (subunit A)
MMNIYQGSIYFLTGVYLMFLAFQPKGPWLRPLTFKGKIPLGILRLISGILSVFMILQGLAYLLGLLGHKG